MVIVFEKGISDPNYESWTRVFVFHFGLMPFEKSMDPFVLNPH